MTGPAEHPRWCTREENNPGLLQHRSKQIRVGARRRIGDRGQVTASLTSTGDGPVWLTVNVAHMIGVTAELKVLDAVDLRDGLTRLLEQAGHEPAGQ